jgi:Dickkopf N-terminal cysteine-rich region
MRRLVCAVFVVLVPACGGSSTPPPPIDLAGLAELRAADIAAECEYLVRCGLFADAAVCTRAFRIADDRSLATAIAEGAVGFDAAAAQQCQTEMAARSCDRTSREGRIPLVCKHVFEGRVPAEETCAFDQECISGSCLLPGCPAGQCCPGGCKAGEPSPPGTACQFDTQCEDEAFCGVDRVCVALVGAGTSCRKDSECAYGLGCVGKTALQDGTCKALPALGQPCPDNACADAGAVCDSTSTCVTAGLLGAACPTGIECSAFYTCGAGGTCEDTPQLGMACTDVCAGAAWCNAGTCAEPQADAASCTIAGKDSQECASQFCLEGPFFSQCATLPICF